MRLYGFECVHERLRAFTRVCMRSQEFTCVCMRSRESASIHMSLLAFVCVHESLRALTRVCLRLYAFTRVYERSRELACVCMRSRARLRPVAKGCPYILVCYRLSIRSDAKGRDVFVDFQGLDSFGTSPGQLGNRTFEAATVVIRQSSCERKHVIVYRQGYTHIGTSTFWSHVLKFVTMGLPHPEKEARPIFDPRLCTVQAAQGYFARKKNSRTVFVSRHFAPSPVSSYCCALK